MLIKADKLIELYPKFNSFDEDLLTHKLSVIESAIRNYTNNKFQARIFRIQTDITNGIINWNTSYLKKDDTIEICDGVNKGLYTIKSIDENGIEVNEDLFDYPMQLIIKVEYPIDVVDGAIDILDWELIQNGKETAGIASESISRHNVSYVQRTSSNTINGYPIELFGFCNDYMNVRS